MRYTLVAGLLGMDVTAGCSGTPCANCVTIGLSALGEAAIYPTTTADKITPQRCDMVKRYIERQGCRANGYQYVADNPETALRQFVPSQSSFSAADISGMRNPAMAVSSACGW